MLFETKEHLAYAVLATTAGGCVSMLAALGEAREIRRAAARRLDERSTGCRPSGVGIAGFGRTKIRYDMFELARGAEEAMRLSKCERIYHRGQTMAWDGKAILAELLERHGGVHIEGAEKRALQRIFAIILWGELAAWKISAQLADGLVDLEAKMAATSQAHDEARHFYVMHDYLRELGYQPERMDRAPQALLDLVLDTPKLPHKLLGMQLMIETMALTIFQTVREIAPEPVIAELMKYFERDEARHVGLGMQYLPSFMRRMNKRELSGMLAFQARLLVWALWELKVLAPDFEALGIDPRVIMERGRRKQLAALHEALGALGTDWQNERNYPLAALNAVTELLFPTEATRPSRRARWRAAWGAFWAKDEIHTEAELDVHRTHAIRTARGVVEPGEPTAAGPAS